MALVLLNSSDMTKPYESEIALPRITAKVETTFAEINSLVRASTEDPETTVSDLIEHLGDITVAAEHLRKLLEEENR